MQLGLQTSQQGKSYALQLSLINLSFVYIVIIQSIMHQFAETVINNQNCMLGFENN